MQKCNLVVFEDYSLEMFYRESWLDPRLTYDVKFRNKSEFSLHESYGK